MGAGEVGDRAGEAGADSGSLGIYAGTCRNMQVKCALRLKGELTKTSGQNSWKLPQKDRKHPATS